MSGSEVPSRADRNATNACAPGRGSTTTAPGVARKKHTSMRGSGARGRTGAGAPAHLRNLRAILFCAVSIGLALRAMPCSCSCSAAPAAAATPPGPVPGGATFYDLRSLKHLRLICTARLPACNVKAPMLPAHCLRVGWREAGLGLPA